MRTIREQKLWNQHLFYEFFARRTSKMVAAASFTGTREVLMSFKKSDLAYNRKQAAEHTASARWAQSDRVRDIHLDLASRYRELVERGVRHVVSIERPDAAGVAETYSRS